MSKPKTETAQLKSYREMMNELLMNFGILGKHAIVIAHNAATNRKETTAAFVNQEMSIPELLEAGWGIELDLHFDEEEKRVVVCHSPTAVCLPAVLSGARPFDEVFAEIAAFKKANPGHPVVVDFDLSSLSKLVKDSAQFNAAIKQIAEVVSLHFPSEKTKDVELCAKHTALRSDYTGNVCITTIALEAAKDFALAGSLREMGPIVLASEQHTDMINRAILNAVQSRASDGVKSRLTEFARNTLLEWSQKYGDIKTTREALEKALELECENWLKRRDPAADGCELPHFFRFYHFGERGVDRISPHEAALKLIPDEVTCKFFQNRSNYDVSEGLPISGLATSYDSAFGAVSTTYTEEAINRLLQCGVRSFKLDYVTECDARQLQIDRFNLEQMLRDHADSPEAALIEEAMERNRELAKTAKYPFPTNSAFLAPLIGKPMADLETLCAAAKYYSGFETEEYGAMIDASEKKYAYHSPTTTFLSAAALGAVRTAISKVDAPGWRHYAALGLNAALTATDLYLYSQSAIPLGAGLLAAKAAEGLGCPTTAVTALKYGCSALVGMALDPGATIGYTLVNSAAGMLGGLSGAAAVEYLAKWAGRRRVDKTPPTAVTTAEGGTLLTDHGKSL